MLSDMELDERLEAARTVPQATSGAHEQKLKFVVAILAPVQAAPA